LVAADFVLLSAVGRPGAAIAKDREGEATNDLPAISPHSSRHFATFFPPFQFLPSRHCHRK